MGYKQYVFNEVILYKGFYETTFSILIPEYCVFDQY